MMQATDGPRPGSLALSFQEVLTAAARLRWKRQNPRDVSAFRQHCRDALLAGADDARQHGYAGEDVRAASFAVAAYLDEAAQHATDPRFDAWLKRTLEAELFHTQDAAEGFYRRLRELVKRGDGHQAADLAEVYQQCLLLGFVGMYGPATGERRKLIEACDAKLRAVRGPVGDLSPGWRAASRMGVRASAGAGPAPAGPGGGLEGFDELVRQADSRLAFAGTGGGVRTAPAILLLGEPGTAKTSSVLHCGVERVELAGEVYGDGNVAPTASANFWLLRKTVLVEAGGALASDGTRWRRLLEWLRPASAAARAALVCLDVERLGNIQEAARMAREMRGRLNEYAQAAGCRIPVYVLFTRLDHVPHCEEFVRRLTHEEAARPVGATLAEHPASGDTAAALATRVKAACDGIYRSLALARTQLMMRESDAERASHVYEFPREFVKLKGVVAGVLSEMCPPGPGAGPFLRGFYFSGARAIVVEQNAPAPAPAPAASGSSLATGMFGGGPVAAQPAAAPQPAGPVRRKVPQWLFLSQLFHEVLLRDFQEG
jgi:type IV/VI secretion system ImpK/VasF family protein